MKAKDFEKAFDKHLEELAKTLAEELTKESGLTFISEGTEVKPKNPTQARVKEFGSNSLKQKAQPFFDWTVRKWAKKNNIKGI